MCKSLIVKSQLLVFASLLIITACGSASQDTVAPILTPTSTPLYAIDLNMKLPEGNAEQGYLKATKYGCFACHVDESDPMHGPRFVSMEGLPNILERGELRIVLPEYKGRATTNRGYMIESIFIPWAFIVPGEWDETMPTHFHQVMTDQELADILAWIATLE